MPVRYLDLRAATRPALSRARLSRRAFAEHVATRQSRLPKHGRTHNKHATSLDCSSTSLPPSSFHTHSSPPFSFLPGSLLLYIPLRQPLTTLTNEIANMRSHLVATVAGLMAGLAVAQDGTSAHISPYTDRKLLILSKPPTSQLSPALSRPSTPPPWSPSTDVARASVTVPSAL